MLGRITRHHAGALIATFRCPAPAPSARSPMSGASWWRRRRPRVPTNARRPWSPRSPRACRCGTSAGGTVLEAGARTDNALFAPACASRPSVLHRYLGVSQKRPLVAARIAGERRIVVGGAGGRAYRRAWVSRVAVAAGVRGSRLRASARWDCACSDRCAHRHPPSRCARAAARSSMGGASWRAKKAVSHR